jgi:hypothetical protein
MTSARSIIVRARPPQVPTSTVYTAPPCTAVTHAVLDLASAPQSVVLFNGAQADQEATLTCTNSALRPGVPEPPAGGGSRTPVAVLEVRCAAGCGSLARCGFPLRMTSSAHVLDLVQYYE